MYDETTSLISRYLSGAIFCGPEAAHFEMRAPVVFLLLHRLLIDTTPNELQCSLKHRKNPDEVHEEQQADGTDAKISRVLPSITIRLHN